ncbi:MAG: NADase-type glycan-binding domain-containing protein [Blautia sp.]
MYCKYCGSEIKEGEVCNCRKQKQEQQNKDNRNKGSGGSRLPAILSFVFSSLGVISIILLRTVLKDILTENIIIEEIYGYLLYLIPGFWGLVALLCAGFSMRDKKIRKAAIAGVFIAVLLIAATGVTGALWSYEQGSYETEIENSEEESEEESEENQRVKDQEKDIQEEERITEQGTEEEKPENKEESGTKDSGFVKIKEDYENGLLDVEGAQKALDEIDAEKVSEEEIDQILAFQEQLEADYEKQIAEQKNAEQIRTGQQNVSDQSIPSVTMSAVTTVSDTSALSEYNMTHSSDRIMDNNTVTAWVEGVSGQGEGESVTFTFDGVYKVSGFVIYGGYQKSSDLYYKNSRPASLLITCSDGSSQVCNLSDILGAQTVTFANPVETDSLTITIQSVYAGNKYEDTVISEISIF